MLENKIIIIGAGASGCMAARELLKAGKDVLVLEARERPGGRIHTLYNNAMTLEAGAEFIHGNLPVTMTLLNEFKIGVFHSGGKMVHLEKGKIKKQNDFLNGWDKMLKEMERLENDMTFGQFLSIHFSEEKYAGLRKSARRFAEGFDVADLNQVSTKALFKEWNDEDEEHAQYRIESGYQKMIDAIVDDCKKRGGNFLLNQRVRQITWKKNHVKVRTEGGEEFQGAKLIITVPLGILWLKPEEGGIQFSPAIDATLELTRKIGYGSVIKFLVQFHKPIWDGVGQGIGFFFVDQSIPTWWTQEPKKDLLLTGWLGGPNASKYGNETDENLQHLVMSELQNAFDLDSSFLHNAIRNVQVFNWSQDAFAKGAYSYPGIETDSARIELSKPIDGVLFFAGEALYDGDTGGTVEAALISGKKVAAELLKIF